jgi:hypothetical protein
MNNIQIQQNKFSERAMEICKDSTLYRHGMRSLGSLVDNNINQSRGITFHSVSNNITSIKHKENARD